MSDIQRDSSRRAITVRVSEAIAHVFENIPERFTTSEVMAKCRLKGVAHMYAVISVLERNFRCTRNSRGIWRKPNTVVIPG